MSATTRLYYTDSTLTEFAAAVVVADPADGCVAVQLDRTACYPTSGGQPNDTGSLGSGRVVDVVDSWVRRSSSPSGLRLQVSDYNSECCCQF